MKKLIKRILVLSTSVLVLCSCEKEEDKVIVKTGAAPILTSSASTVVLNKADKDKEAVSFSWTPADYGFTAGVKYALQFDKKGNNFVNPRSVMFDSIHKIAYKGGELNWIALNLGLAKGVAKELEVRVKSGISSSIDSLSSNTTTISVTPYIGAPELTGSKPTIALAKDNANLEAITFTGVAADFGFKDAEVKYYLEFDKQGNNFGKPKKVPFIDLKKTFLIKDINQIAKGDLGMFVGSASNLEVRLKATVSAMIDSVVSNTLSYSVTPYPSADLVEYSTLFMVGDATEFAWDATKATPMFRSATNKYIYTFSGYFKKGELKFLATLGQWIPMWGSNGGTGVAFRETNADSDPSSFSVLEDGYHTVTLDIELLKFTITDYGTVPTAYGDMKMNGDFNGWGAGIAFTNSVFNPHVWRLEYTFSGASSMKFQTGNWSSQFGPTKDWSNLYGILDGTVDNLYILSGTYSISFNDLTKQYLYIKK